MLNGYIKLHRQILETSFYKDPNSLYLAVHLLFLANWKDTKFTWNTEVQILKKGQLITGRKKLAEDSGLTENKIRRSLIVLENAEFIAIKTTSQFSLITICNWDVYQCDDVVAPPTDHQRITNGSPHIKKDKKNKNIYTVHFEEIWKMYPKRIGKKEALRHFNTSVITDEDLDKIKVALKNYMKSDTVKNGYIQNGSTWFNNWNDYIPENKPVVKKEPEVEEDIPSPFEDMLKEKEKLNGIQTKTKGKEKWCVDLV